MTVWTNFAEELETAAIAVVTADSVVGVGGVLDVQEVVKLQAVSGEILYVPTSLPSIGIAAVNANVQDTGPLDEIRVRIVAICAAGPTSEMTHEEARSRVLGIAARVTKVLKDFHGTNPGASGHPVLVRDTGADDVDVDDDDLVQSVAVSVVLGALHREG